jgi:HD-like signal output (HDOD) protein
LAKRWKLPKNIREVIRYHHNPEKAIKARKLTHIVSVANVLAYLFMAGLTLENISVEAFDESLAYIGLKKEDIPLIIDQIPWNRIMYA